MALEANGQWFCKVVHTENGRTWTRRIHAITVQTANGRLHLLDGTTLPDSISLYSGAPLRGAHMAEVLLSPKEAKGVPLLPAPSGWLSKRDAFFICCGHHIVYYGSRFAGTYVYRYVLRTVYRRRRRIRRCGLDGKSQINVCMVLSSYRPIGIPCIFVLGEDL